MLSGFAALDQCSGCRGRPFEALRDAELQKIGVRMIQSSDQVIPADQLDETVRYLQEYKPVVGFFANQGHASDE